MKQKHSLSKVSPNFIVFLLICTFFTITFLSVLGKSPTYDEARNFNYGRTILDGDSNRPADVSKLDGTRIAGSMMPLSTLNAVPFKIASYLPDGGLKAMLKSMLTARAISIFVSILIALLIYYWSRTLYGIVPAMFSLLLYVFDPNIIAHSQLVTTDMYAWGTTLLVFFCSWKFANNRSWQNGLLWSAAIGISSLAKYTTVVLIPLSLLTIFIHDMPELLGNFKHNPGSTAKNILAKYGSYFLSCMVISIVFINIGFLFNKTLMRFGDYGFYSHLLNGIQTGIPALKNAPVPVPFPYLEGFDLTYYYGEEGRAFGNTYLLGTLHNGKQGFPGYYLIASFFKVPIATQLIILAVFYFYLSKKDRRQRFLSDDVFLLLPILFFTIYFNFFFSINIGIRYYLVFFPLLFVFCGGLFTGWQEFSRFQKSVSTLLIGYLAISTLSYFPTYMPYFNEFLFDKKQAYKILADSNIDYGQSEGALNRYLESHPQAIYNPTSPTSGLIVAGVNNLVGVFGEPGQYAWLRENFEPDDMITRTYLIYHISSEQITALCNTSNYCK